MLHVNVVSSVCSCLPLQAEHLVASFFPKKLLELDQFLKVSDWILILQISVRADVGHLWVTDGKGDLDPAR